MILYHLKIGKSKKKMQTQMIAPLSTVNVYLQSRNANGKTSGKFSDGKWFQVEQADKNQKEFYKKSCTVGGNKSHTVPKINKQGKTVIPGYISKNGFQPHT